MNTQMIHGNDDFVIERLLRPVSKARRILRDHMASKFNSMTCDDAPDAGTIRIAIDVVQEALTATAAPGTARPVIMQMLTGKPVSPTVADEFVAAITDLPLLPVALAASKRRGSILMPSPEQFLQSCLRARENIDELLDRLDAARTSFATQCGRLAMIVPTAPSRRP